MRDLAVLAFLVLSIGLAFRRPWLGVLSLAIFSYMNPQAYAWGFMRSFPVYQTLFIAVFAAFLTEKNKQPLPSDWRIAAFFLLWLYFIFTTFQAVVPQAAWDKLFFVSKVYLPLFFTLVLIDNRNKLYYLILAISLAVGLIAVKGGLFALITGFNFRVYGAPSSFYGGNNEFAIVTLMVIPLIFLLYKESPNKWIKQGSLFAIPLCFASAISSWSRGAFLTMSVLLMTILWESNKKILLVPVIGVGLYLAAGQLPDEWFERMATIQTYEDDSSAQGRLEVWRDGYYYAIQHPFKGSGFEGWKYVSMRDWHNSFIEIFAEHGIVAFMLWMSLLVGSIVSLSSLPNKVKKYHEMSWVKNYSSMLRAALITYAVGSLFLGLSYWDIFYHLVFISILVKKFALEEYEQLALTKESAHTEQVKIVHNDRHLSANKG